jgi:general secretion pathway protein G
MRHQVGRSGFTLMEMMLVLGIIALLLGGGIYTMKNAFKDAEIVRVKADFNNIKTNLMRYRMRAQSMPTTEQGLNALVNRPTLAPVPQVWESLVEPQAIVDPWGSPYQYKYPGKEKEYDLSSWGPDRKPNTEDDIYF